jgi:hypothetical protein
MPRLSLYKPEKGNNYRFIDRQISRMFQVGCTDVHLHKYLGPKNPTEGTADQPIYDVIKETNIQDLLFLENRDRKYDQEIYRVRGHYQLQNLNFNLSQFGLFIDNDTVFMTVHINDMISALGRKPIAGDVMELPHLKDDFALNDLDLSMPRFFVVEEVDRPSEGYSATWYPHLYRLKLKKLTDTQQYSDILDKPAGEDVPFALRELLSTRNKELEITDAIVRQSELDVPLCGYETRQFYTLAIDPDTGGKLLLTVDTDEIDTSYSSQTINGLSNINVNSVNAVPLRTGYNGYLFGDGYPPNGYVFGTGIRFPSNAAANDYYLRVDFLPNRLFTFNGQRWIKVEDNIRMTMTNTDSRQTLKTSFINNNKFTYVDEVAVDYVRFEVGDFEFNTQFTYPTTALYLVLKFETTRLEFVIADHPDLIQSYTEIGVNKIKVTLPIVDASQITIPYAGAWRVMLFNHRENERQSITQALRPKASMPEADF